MKEDRSVCLEDLTNDPIAQESEVAVSLGIHSVAGTPLRYEGKVIGAITVGSTTAKYIDAKDRLLIGYMANQITLAIIKAQLYKEEKEARLKLSALENVSEAGLTTLSIDGMLNEIAQRIASNMNVDWSGIILFEDKHGMMIAERTSNGCSSMKGKSMSNGCEVISDILAKGKTRVLKKNSLSEVKRHVNESEIKSIAIVPINLRQDRACTVAIGKKARGSFTDKELQLLELLSSRAAFALENAMLFSRLEQSYLDTIESLVKAIEAKDKYTRGHSEQVATLAREIALVMGLDRDRAERIYTAGLLHDVGKIGISSGVLCKPSILSPEEYDEIKLHPIKGYEILKPIRSFADLAEIVLQHHERFDGSGYPRGLRGNDIFLEARILAIADAYQAMISSRPYRKGLPIDQAILEIRKGAGGQFDPEIANIFINMLEQEQQQSPRPSKPRNIPSDSIARR
ncbi:MAG: HD domain-containing phosphohydrolase [Candidatus Aquicultor sp.]